MSKTKTVLKELKYLKAQPEPIPDDEFRELASNTASAAIGSVKKLETIESRLPIIAGVICQAMSVYWNMVNKQNPVNIKLIDDLMEPRQNDYVMEVTNPHAPALHQIGKMLERNGSSYLIQLLDGTTCSWENARMIKIPDQYTQELLEKVE